MESSVHVKEAILITPSDQTPNKILSLSSLDSQLFLRFTIEYLFVYKARPGLNPSLTTSRVKAALAKSLVSYYPLAGRVRSKPDGSGLEVLCCDQGAVFIEATSDHTVNDFETAPEHVDQWRKLLTLRVEDVLASAPPLVVQLTWLKDGGATFGIGISHCLADGIGSAEFLNSFAELAKFITRGGVEFRNEPIWDRHVFDIDSTYSFNSASLSHPEFNAVPDLCRFMNRFSKERLTPTSVVFDKRSLNELKRVSHSTSRLRNDSTFSSFEVLSAHVWRSWARSLNLPSSQTLKLLFSINVRKRVKPSLPSGYYGNAFVLGCAQTTVKDLTEKGLRYASMLVKRAKERVDNEYVRSVVNSVSGERRACPDSVGVLIMSQWSRLGLESVDFGLGKPVHVGPICCDRYCLLLPSFNQTGGTKVMVAVPTNAVDKYEYLVRSLYS